MAKMIHHRINQLYSIDTVELMIQFKIGRCHELKGSRKNEYALDLIHPFRLVFVKDGFNDRVEIVKIISIEDYH